MIKYKCASCGIKLETEDSLSGKQEACPACGKVNPVPLSKCDPDEQQRQEAESRQMIKERVAKNKEREAEKLRQQAEIAQAEKAQTEESGSVQPKSSGRPGFTEPSRTEETLGSLGVVYMILGVVGFFVGFVVALPEGLWGLLYGLVLLVSCFLAGISCFAAQWVLCYLRRITNAINNIERLTAFPSQSTEKAGEQ